MAGIELKHIQKAYTVDGRTFPVLKDICLQIPENSITVLLGKSGCGKTTPLSGRFGEAKQRRNSLCGHA